MKKNFTSALKFCIALTIFFSILIFSAKAQIVNTYNSTTTWVCPPGVTTIKVECWGAGGAGGGANTKRTGGGGGGGGAFAINNTVTVVPGTTYTITVGTGGVGTTGNGASGGPSIFGSSISAFGGVGGSSPSTAATSASGGAGGTGGFGGTTYFVGGNGSNSTYISTSNYTSGSGGGGAGSTSAGAAAVGLVGGVGGTLEGGAGGNGFDATAGAVNGNPGAAIGAGGGGGIRDNNSGTQRNGGNGANGQVRITYTLPACVTPTAQPTALVLTPAATTIAGSFTAAASVNSYLVVRTSSATAPSNPIDGTTYFVGSSSLGGYIESVGSSTTFISTGLSTTTQYWYWVFSYNNICTGGPLYNIVAPLTNNATTLTPACVAPISQPTSLILTPTITTIAASFTAASGTDGYLVIRTSTSTAPSNPANGTTYTTGTSALGGFVESVGAATTYTSTGLSGGVQYWYWIYGYNSLGGCSGGIQYNTTSPLTNNTTTLLPPCSSPISPASSLVLTAYSLSISGTFTASASANRYLVIRTATATAPSNPVNGTTYTAGTSALGGFIEGVGTSTTFNSIGLAANTTYWYWVFAYNGVSCSGGPLYYTATPATANATTVSCGSLTNVALITSTAGASQSGSTYTFNWSALPWSLGHVPTSCENVLLQLDRTSATSNEDIDVNLDVNVSILNFKMSNISNTARRIVFGTKGSSTFLITGDAVMECPGGTISNKFNRCVFSNTKSTTITGNLTLGRVGTLTASTEGHSAIGSTGSSSNQVFNVKGNMTFNPRGYTTDEWTVFNFDNGGTQFIYNNTRPLTTDTIQPVLFEDLRIGLTNPTTLIMQGSMYDGYIESVGRAGVTIGPNSALDLPANYSMNVISGGSTSLLKMQANSKLRLGGDRSINDIYGGVHGVAGSNFPGGFTYNLDPTSTIEYYGNNSITQTIFNGVTYKNLLVTNSVQSNMVAPPFPAGTAHAQKITTGPIVSNTSININGFADVVLGTLGSSTNTVQSDGPLNILTDGGLFCNANVVSGVGAFTMNAFSTLGMGHAQGISPSGSATGNIQMTGGRTYNTTGNYVYNGIVPQITGVGLPAVAVNDLTIDNPTTVTIANNQLVNGVHLLKQGVFNIQTNKITVNGVGIMNAITGKMKADQGIVEMKGNTGTAQNLSGNWFVNKTINILTNANTTGISVASVPADTLLISEALDYNGVTGSTITTNDNLTLLSRLTKTANFGNATGNAIVGKVNVERYMFARSAWRLLATPIQIATSPTVSQAWRENNAPHTATGYGTRITGPSGTYGPAGTLDDYSINPSLKSYNAATNNFTGVVNTNTTPIANLKGYYVFVRGDRSAAAIIGLSGITNLRIKGDLRTGTQIFPVPANKFESVGNPFASRIDMRTVNKANVVNAFYVWNPNNTGLYNVGSYEAYLYNAISGNYERVGDGFIRNYIESGEAFYLQSNVASPSGTITIKETDKGNGSANVSRPGVALPSLDLLLYAQNADSSMYVTDGIKMNFDSTNSNDIDNNDVRKINNSYDNIALKNGTTNLIVERRGNLQATDTLRFNISGMRVANYRLDIDPTMLNYPGLEATLVDKFLQTKTTVSFIDVTNIAFTITADAASRATDRFMIVFRAIPTVRFNNIAAIRNADKAVKVNWSVDNEVNVENYTVEHSTDGINFAVIGLEAATMNNGGMVNYTRLHSNASEQKNWYRIKANSAFGSPIYSAIALVSELSKTASNPNASITIVPTVVTDGQVNVILTNQVEGKYSLVITNAVGQIIKQSQVNVDNDKFTYNLKTGTIAKGTYQLTVINTVGEKTSMAFIVK
jgi:hypothetical protein